VKKWYGERVNILSVVCAQNGDFGWCLQKNLNGIIVVVNMVGCFPGACARGFGVPWGGRASVWGCDEEKGRKLGDHEGNGEGFCVYRV
jgi:hypothetical protein